MKSAVSTELKVPLAGLSPLHGRRVPSPQGEVALFRLSDGGLRAVLNRCPHKGGSLAEGIVSSDFVFCTQHDWKICLSNGEAQAPDMGCVKAFKVRSEDGFAIIELGA